MPSLKIMPNRNTWYAKVKTESGRSTTINLHVKIRGKRPPNLKMNGDEVFERSRIKAQDALDKLVDDNEDPRAAIRAQENILRLKGAEKPKSLKLSELPAIAGSQSKGSKGQRRDVIGRAKQFSDFMIAHRGNIEIAQVKAADLQTFYDQLKDSKGTFRRRHGELKRLFKEAYPSGVKTPFEIEAHKQPTLPDHIAEDKLIPHRPFTPIELKRIFKEAQGTIIEHIVILAAATGLRKGDLCTLKWEAVDLENDVIEVIPNKTKKSSGKQVTIPLAGQALTMLKSRLPIGEFVFPDLAALYQTGKSGEYELKKALKQVLSVALATNNNKSEPSPLTNLPPAEAYMACVQFIKTIATTQKRKDRFQEVCRLYLLEDLSYVQIQEQHGISKSQCSEALKELQSGTGVKLIRNPKTGVKAQINDLTTTKSDTRKYRQSVYDWHSFRTTWITEALKAGWSIADVQKVTGQAEVEIVLLHYYNPDAKHLKSLPAPASALA